MNPNHFLAVAIDYLVTHRPQWSQSLVIGKTLVSSAMIDKVCEQHQRVMSEVPVGFKWFVDGLAQSTFAFGGEESAGAAFLRRDGTTWCTDKDGFILALLAAEMLDTKVLGDTRLAGEAITSVLTKAPGNQAKIGGIKVVTNNAWFAARPSGTEALFKIYGESFVSQKHLDEVIAQAQAMIETMLN